LSMAAEIESRTIDGRLFLSAEDVVSALRLRAPLDRLSGARRLHRGRQQHAEGHTSTE